MKKKSFIHRTIFNCSFLFPFLTGCFILVCLELLIKFKWISEFILPRPSQVFITLIQEAPFILEAAQSTFLAILIALVSSFILAFCLAVLVSSFSFLKQAIYPFAIFFQTVPLISVAPLLVIWFGFGQKTIVISGMIVCFFPILVNILSGLESTDPELVELFKLYSASYKNYLFKLKIPFALPQIFSGLEIASGVAVIGVLVGEFISGGGLGGLIDSARSQQRLELVFAAIFISSFIGLLLVNGIRILSSFILGSWHPSKKESGKIINPL